MKNKYKTLKSEMMRISKNSLILCSCMMVMVMASCNIGEDYYNPTPEEISKAAMTIKGDYTGEMIYYDAMAMDAISRDITDTIKVSWQFVNDSVLIIKNFPVQLLAQYINDTKLSNAIAKQTARNIKCSYSISSIDPIGFFINFIGLKYDVAYGDESHKIVLYVDSRNSVGLYSTQTKSMQIRIVVGGIYVDGIQRQDLLYLYYNRQSTNKIPFVLQTILNNKK